ncbi:unnamed protein product [Caenorhabditis auriculariae]|uniref:Prostaglandin E synthase 2 n=1 Tax=Caenorhabditis auriculariae TaxID=2777116 RepID=A0A8S1HIN6_9PELO|nr:unnamed protein product [Caenorhabditis auriculariae]
MWTLRTLRFAPLTGFFGGVGSTEKREDSKRTCPIQVLKPEKAENGNLFSRKIINHLDKNNLQMRLYQYETCPFCCKVRAFLDYYGFSYDVVEVNPVTRSQIKFSTQYKKVPILMCKDHAMTESSLIVSQLASYLHRPERSFDEICDMYPAVESSDDKGKKIITHPNKYFVMMEKMGSSTEMAQTKEEREWREWVDTWFIHLISPNVYRTWDESLETFKWFEQIGDWHRTFPAWERVLAVYIGALAMFALSKRLKKRHGIDDERQAMNDACEKWVEALGSRPFMGGTQPNLADLALFGAMNSFHGCRTFEEIVSGGRIAEWWKRMKSAVENHEGRTVLEGRTSKK